jgi:hypothetical protein
MANMPAPAEVPECPARNAIRAISTIRLALLPARISNSMRGAGVISDRGWPREFDDPIVLPEGKNLRTLRDAAVCGPWDRNRRGYLYSSPVKFRDKATSYQHYHRPTPSPVWHYRDWQML